MVWKNIRWLVFFGVLGVTGGCAAREHLMRGNEHLKQGRHTDAVIEYERALRKAPDNATAKEGIRKARRLGVRIELRKSSRHLKRGEFAKALRRGLNARRMPLDLEDVDLVQKIDRTIGAAVKAAETRVREFVRRKHYISAVELANGIVYASPGERAREVWAQDIRVQAVDYYTALGEKLTTTNPGSAALVFALANRASGEKIEPGSVAALWDEFAQPICFATPMVEVKDSSEKLGEMGPRIERRLVGALSRFQERCGQGQRPLGVRLVFDEVTVVDSTVTATGATPLPGVRVKTEETYFEEIPYTEIEEFEEFEVRVEKQERRDCAPLPGKPRGCRTWIEDVEVNVPVIRKKEVRKLRKVERKRPIKNLPADKVVHYEVTSVTRRVTYGGSVQVSGTHFEPERFLVTYESSDSGNEEVRSRGVVVELNPLEVDSMEQVEKKAGTRLFRSIKRVLGRAVVDWTKEIRDQARQHAVAKEDAAAEEAYLSLIALGVKPDQEVNTFFKNRYGLGVKDMLGTVSLAVGRRLVDSRQGGAMAKTGPRFPKRGVPKRAVGRESGKATSLADAALEATRQAKLKVKIASGEQETESGFTGEAFEGSDEELVDFSDLIDASMEEDAPKEAEKKPAAQEGGEPEQTSPSKKGDPEPRPAKETE